MKFDATRAGAYVILELNHRNPRKRAAMMQVLQRYRNVIEDYFPNAIWQESYIKECGTEVSRIYREQTDLNIHKREHWRDFYVFLSKNMNQLEKAFDQIREQLADVAANQDL